MSTNTQGIRERLAPETAWRRVPVQVYLRADDSGNAPQLRFRLESGDEVTSVRAESEALRTLAEKLLRTAATSGRCSYWFG